MNKKYVKIGAIGLAILGCVWCTHSIISNEDGGVPPQREVLSSSQEGHESASDTEGEPMKATTLSGDSEGDKKGEGSYYVYVTGAVENPGLYHLDHAMVMKDVLQACGGLLPYADTEGINVAASVPAGTHVHVPFSFTGKPEELLRKQKININTATEEELVKIQGIGPATAKRIVQTRMEKGAFTTIADIKKVKGIGNGLFKKMEASITI